MNVETSPASLVELLRKRRESPPELEGYRFSDGGTDGELALTYAELDRRARTIAVALAGAGAGGERILLLFPPGPDYLAAFFGCLYAGAVAVPVQAPHPARLKAERSPLGAIAADARPRAVLTSGPYLSRSEALRGEDEALRSAEWMATGSLDPDLAGAWKDPGVTAGDLAYLQYTSGSTGTPKGVMVSHGNLLANLDLMARRFELSPGRGAVLWLPPYHDMGLIGGLLQPLYSAFPVTLLSPVHFLRRPFSWLEAISRTRAAVAGGPNFGYDLCVDKVTEAERASLDLSSWEVAFNGAEPVRPETLERFAEAFGPCGFRREALYPCYGLAEASLFVSGGPRRGAPSVRSFSSSALENGRAREPRPEEASRSHVACGTLPQGSVGSDPTVAVVDPETLEPCAEGRVGEIWVAGASVARGYWEKPEETRRAFGGRLRDQEGPSFLRTGDLGFVSRGELFVTGRLKDLVIIRGRNLYPQDVERTVEECHPSLRPGGAAVFSVEADREERLVVVQEVERRARKEDPAEVMEAVRRAVAEGHDVRPRAVVLVSPGGVPRTTSGKVRRRACRELFLEGRLPVLREWRESEGSGRVDEGAPEPRDLPSRLMSFLAGRLGAAASEIDLDRPFSALGLDSLAAVELAHFLETETGVQVSPERFFEAPSLAWLASELAAARPETSVPAPAAPPEGDDVPLSAGQKALWFLHRLHPESTDHHLVRAFRVPAGVDSAALRRAFQVLLERHPALRTVYPAPGGEPRGRLEEGARVSFTEVDADGWDEARLEARLEEAAFQALDLEHGPILRVHLFAGGESSVLVVSVHHIAADLWSLSLMLAELSRLYGALRSGRELPPPAGAASYGSFVRWQERELEGPAGEALWSYWSRQLAGDLPALRLPADRSRPEKPSGRGAAHSFRLGPALTARLRELSRKCDATLNMTLLAAFKTLLYRYTGRDDLLVGMPAAGRSRAETAGVVGYFVNPLVIRSRPAADARFVDHLAAVRLTVLEALAHQDYPFPLLVERLRPAERGGRAPIFQVLFAMQAAPGAADAAELALGEDGARPLSDVLPLRPLALERQAAPFDLTLMMAEAAGVLAASLQYDVDLFDAATVARLAGHFRTLLESVAADPECVLSELPLLGGQERHRMLVEWNDTATGYPRDLCVHEVFESRAAAWPDAVAVAFEDRQLTYAELGRRADRLARRLRALGVGPDVRVGLAAERSLEMVVATLAVLEAGGAYVPLDPGYPDERLAFMLEESRARVLLAPRRLLDRLPETGAEVVPIDDPPGSAAAPEAALPACEVGPDHLAYVMYTSGSTGRPKGVSVTHRNIVATLCDADWAELNAEETLLQFAPISFDLATFEIWGSLLNGGRLVVCAPGTPSLAELGDQLLRHKVTTLWLTSGLFSQMVDHQLESLAGLRQLLAGGDVVSPVHARRVLERLDGRLINGYGPTEGTIFSSCYPMTDPRQVSKTVPIGPAIGNRRLYVLDARLQPVPAGVPGELYVGGDAVARGYLGRPELTAERFVADPFAAGNETLYRTGDRVRYRPDGTLEFLGRDDDQVKIRGFRIEPGETAALLARHPRVREAAVVTRTDGRGEKQLVAYVVPAGDDFSSRELKSFLAGRLPDYMVPSAFCRLAALPLTPNGKIDKKALPDPDPAERAAELFVAPRTPLEKALAGMWSDVLGTPRIGLHDNFFDVGGHSLRATQLVSRVESAFRVGVPLSDLFASPTVAGLSRALIAREPRPGQLEKIAGVLARVREMSDEDAAALLRRRRAPGGEP